MEILTASEMGRRGGLARAKKLNKRQRRVIARMGGLARAKKRKIKSRN